MSNVREKGLIPNSSEKRALMCVYCHKLVEVNRDGVCKHCMEDLK